MSSTKVDDCTRNASSHRSAPHKSATGDHDDGHWSKKSPVKPVSTGGTPVGKFESVLEQVIDMEKVETRRADKWLADYAAKDKSTYSGLVRDYTADYLKRHRWPDGKTIQCELVDLAILSQDEAKGFLKRLWNKLLEIQDPPKHSDKYQKTPSSALSSSSSGRKSPSSSNRVHFGGDRDPHRSHRSSSSGRDHSHRHHYSSSSSSSNSHRYERSSAGGRHSSSSHHRSSHYPCESRHSGMISARL